MTPAQIEAAARELHRFNAPRVANDVESWDSLSAPTQARYLKQADMALRAALAAFDAETPVVESRE